MLREMVSYHHYCSYLMLSSLLLSLNSHFLQQKYHSWVSLLLPFGSILSFLIIIDFEWPKFYVTSSNPPSQNLIQLVFASILIFYFPLCLSKAPTFKVCTSLTQRSNQSRNHQANRLIFLNSCYFGRSSIHLSQLNFTALYRVLSCSYAAFGSLLPTNDILYNPQHNLFLPYDSIRIYQTLHFYLQKLHGKGSIREDLLHQSKHQIQVIFQLILLNQFQLLYVMQLPHQLIFGVLKYQI